jgi:hypothetical protein
MCVVAMACALPGGVQAQDRQTAVVGYLWTAANVPIAGAAVQLRDTTSGQIVAASRTDNGGEFTFRPVAGSYVVEYVDAAERVLALGNPFTVAAGETVATFVRVGSSRPQITGARPTFEFGLGLRSLWRDGTAGAAPGGGLTAAVGGGRVSLFAEAGVARRAGHNDWRVMGGLRLWAVDNDRSGMFVSAGAGTLIRNNLSGPSFSVGAGAEVRTSSRLAIRLQADLLRDRANTVWANAARGSIWVIVR